MCVVELLGEVLAELVEHCLDGRLIYGGQLAHVIEEVAPAKNLECC